MLTAQTAEPGSDVVFDLDADRRDSQSDVIYWVEVLANTFIGDSNLDGEFNSSDLVVVFTAGEYEDDASRNSVWSQGDWNGDGDCLAPQIELK